MPLFPDAWAHNQQANELVAIAVRESIGGDDATRAGLDLHQLHSSRRGRVPRRGQNLLGNRRHWRYWPG